MGERSNPRWERRGQHRAQPARRFHLVRHYFRCLAEYFLILSDTVLRLVGLFIYDPALENM